MSRTGIAQKAGLPQARIGDRSRSATAGCTPACTGSSNVLVNNKPALRVADLGTKSGKRCWEASIGAPRVLINNVNAHRMGDADQYMRTVGETIEGSSNVLIGDWCGASPERQMTWIEIRLVDGLGHPIPYERYKIRLSDGSIRAGRLDARGSATITDFHTGSGECHVNFRDLQPDDWRPCD